MEHPATTPRLIIVCGLPGSGKTTAARAIELQRRAIRLCPDEWMATLAIDLFDEGMRARIEALQWELAQSLLRLGLSVIIEWGTWARAERDALRTGARALGAGVELHALVLPTEELLERIRCRGRENPPIERADLDLWHAAFEVPTPEEIALFDSPLDCGERGKSS